MSTATKILMGSGGVDLPSDDEFDNVSFLSHFDGANNGTNIVYDDSSDSNHTMTVAGTPSQGTFSPFSRPDGEWSTYFDGSDYFTVPSSSDFAFGTGDFTIEGWVYFVAGTGNNQQMWQLSNGHLNSQLRGPALMVDVTTGKWRWYYGTTAVTHGSIGPDQNTWYHFAFVRNSGTSKLYIDGTEILSVSDSTNYTDTYFVIGGNWNTSYLLNGYLSNFRIVKGTAVYTSNFTPPTSALTSTGSDTKLLTCQSNRFIDNSTSAHAITVAGTPKASAFTPILTSKVYKSAVNGASGYFDDTNDVIHLDGSGSDFTFGTGAFTIEGWVYPEGAYGEGSSVYVLAGGAMLTIYTYQNINISFVISYSNAAAASTNVISLTATNLRNQWSHFAVTRSGSDMSAFYNGTRVGTVSNASGTFLALSGGGDLNNIHVGAYDTSGSYDFDGYISNIRIVKGTAVYDPTASTYTVPTAPLTAIDDTVLLLNMADGQALDSAAQNNMTLLGNADTSTTQQKFGTASLYLDGSSWATMPGPTYGTGDFTWEAWVYQTSRHASTWSLIFAQDDYEAGNSISCWITHEGKASIYYEGGGTHFTTSSTFPVNTWTHLAFVREGTGTDEFSIYINGVAGVTGTMTTSFDQDGIVIGRKESSPGYYYTGYIDEIRMSSMARYTSNFTPTTEAFADKGQ